MSERFDDFGKQLLEVLDSITELKEENKCLKESKCKLDVDVRRLNKKNCVLEQNAVL